MIKTSHKILTLLLTCRGPWEFGPATKVLPPAATEVVWNTCARGGGSTLMGSVIVATSFEQSFRSDWLCLFPRVFAELSRPQWAHGTFLFTDLFWSAVFSFQVTTKNTESYQVLFITSVYIIKASSLNFQTNTMQSVQMLVLFYLDFSLFTYWIFVYSSTTSLCTINTINNAGYAS